MPEYIERDIAVKHFEKSKKVMWHKDDIAAAISNEIPTADVVEVVRCRECQEWRRNSGFVDSPNGHCFYHSIDTNGYDFCSYGTKARKG